MDKTFGGRQSLHATKLNFKHLDLFVQVVTAPFLLAPSFFRITLVVPALLLLLLPYITRLVFGRPLSQPSPANLPVAVLAFIFIPLAFVTSPAPWSVGWERLTVLAWSIALFFMLVNRPASARRGSSRTRFNGSTIGYLALGLLVALVGLLGMRSVDKLFTLPWTAVLVPILGLEQGLPTNEIAGVLTLFAPFVFALVYGCAITGRRRQLLLLLPVALLMAVVLVLAQSRTGLVAVAAGTLMALAISGNFGRKWLIVGLVTAGVGLVVLRLTPALHWFVFAGANSWNNVIGPRWSIWQQAVTAIRDQPLWGMGLGVFGQLARSIYPLSEPSTVLILEDAHNLYFQTALDFGLAGLLVFVVAFGVVLFSAVRLARARPAGTLSRLWAAGLAGALVAHALYSLTDAVALGTLAGVPLWYLFALVMGASRGRLQPQWTNGAKIAFVAAVFAVMGMSTLAMSTNRAGRLATSAYLDEGVDLPAAATRIGSLAERDCRARWYEGVVRHEAGDVGGRAAAWGDLLGCTDAYIPYMAVLAASDATLARLAIDAQPGSPHGYFWLAPTLAAGEPDEAIALYRQGLTLAPGDGHRWLALAELLEPRDPAAALEAYLQACLNGDPGANGCFRAGRLAEESGDIASAIAYYRLSNWEDAHRMAADLERELVTREP